MEEHKEKIELEQGGKWLKKKYKERKQQTHIFLHCTNLWLQVYTLQNMILPLFQIKKKKLKGSVNHRSIVEQHLDDLSVNG